MKWFTRKKRQRKSTQALHDHEKMMADHEDSLEMFLQVYPGAYVRPSLEEQKAEAEEAAKNIDEEGLDATS